MREAHCRCGQLKAQCDGDPVRISVCHCLDCQRRSGSAFAAQARFPNENVTISGESKTWVHHSENGQVSFHFCPECGSTLFYENESMPGLTAVAIGGFADPTFPPPQYSVWETRQHPWTGVLGPDVEHWD